MCFLRPGLGVCAEASAGFASLTGAPAADAEADCDRGAGVEGIRSGFGVVFIEEAHYLPRSRACQQMRICGSIADSETEAKGECKEGQDYSTFTDTVS